MKLISDKLFNISVWQSCLTLINIIVITITLSLITRSGYAQDPATGWQIVKTVPGTVFEDIEMLSTTDGWAVGGQYGFSTVFHWDGNNWNEVTDPGQNMIFTVDMINGNEGWFGGLSGELLHYNTGVWLRLTPPTAMTIQDISMLSTDEGWAVGGSGYPDYQGVILHYQNNNWQVHTTPIYQLNAVKMISTNEGWAVGGNGVIYHYSNGSWQNVSSPTTNWLFGLDMVSTNEGWAVGSYGTILHYSNGTWQKVSSPTSYRLYDVDMLSANEGWAVAHIGGGNGGVILHYLNGTWHADPGEISSGLFTVDMLTNMVGWAAGADGDNVILQYIGVDTYSISGRIIDNSSNPISDVTISDGAGHTTTTDSNGDYTLTRLSSGNYTLAPSKSGYTFSPTSRTTSVPPNATSQNFTATLNTYSVSGRIIDNGSNPISGVTVSDGTGHTVTTDSNGTYTLIGLAAGSYILVPSKSGYSFSPLSRTINVPPNATNQNFNGEESTDLFEPNNTCTQAGQVFTDGTIQEHIFYKQADEDWVVFQATAGTTYRIEAQVPPESLADVTLEVYGQCAGELLEEQDYTFSPGVVQEFTAPASGSIYLRWVNHDPAIYGNTVAYQLSVRTLAPQATSGAVIIVAGRLKSYDDLQPNIHYISNQVYQLFQGNGYSADRIAYLATDLSLPGVDAPATAANLQEAITTWAMDKVDADHSLTLYLVDHGTTDMLYLDEPAGQWVTSTQLDSWLTQLETTRPGLKVNVIIEACKSGSFIKLEQTISKKGRVIITSTGSTNDAYAPRPGAVFSDRFIAAMKQGQSLHQSFLTAKWATEIAYSAQTPWLDDGGNSIPNETTDGTEAAQRGFGLTGTLAGEIWPPYIQQGVAPVEIDQGSGVLRAQVLDDLQVKRVWAVIYAPSYQPPPSGEELVNEVLPTIVLQSQGNDWYAASYPGFNEIGVYRVVIYAEDYDGWEARPLAVEVQTGWDVYLPLIVK